MDFLHEFYNLFESDYLYLGKIHKKDPGFFKNNFKIKAFFLNKTKNGLSWKSGLFNKIKTIYFKSIYKIFQNNTEITLYTNERKLVLIFPNNYQSNLFYESILYLSKNDPGYFKN